VPDGPPGALVAVGWSDRVSALFKDFAGARDEPARIVRVERSASVAVCIDGRYQKMAALAAVAVGDWVVVRDNVICHVLPRWSAVDRQDPSGNHVQTLAANVDLVMITAPADRLSPARVERELAVAWDSGARPLVLLTKADLGPADAQTGLQARLAGVDVIATSTQMGAGIEAVAEALRPDRTAVLLGPSGAGKSTLVNALLGVEFLATGAVREGDHRGRHTTTSRQLVGLPGGGVLIDTPGLRTLGLAGDGSIELVFPEIDELAGDCRFTDCHHGVEPDCAVTGALSAGTLEAGRLASFRKLQGEAAAKRRRR